jgi:hypothetical protein
MCRYAFPVAEGAAGSSRPGRVVLMITKPEKYALDLIVRAVDNYLVTDEYDENQLTCPEACDHAGLCPPQDEAWKLVGSFNLWIENHPEVAAAMMRHAVWETAHCTGTNCSDKFGPLSS